MTLRYAPGETFVNTKQRRVPVSLDAPTFTLSHTAGFKGVLGGEYNLDVSKRQAYTRTFREQGSAIVAAIPLYDENQRRFESTKSADKKALKAIQQIRCV